MAKKILKWAGIVMAAFVVVIGIVIGSMLRESPPPSDCPAPLDMSKVRALANSLQGYKPHEVRVEKVMGFSFPWALVRAGGSFEKVKMAVFAYQVVYPDRTIMVDTAMPAAQGKFLEDHDDAAEERVFKGTDKAQTIFVTHEHVDHLGGLFAPGHEGYKHAQLTAEQMAAPERMDPVVMTAEQRAAIKTITYDTMAAVAPGIVLIKAPGHTPGSQWVYIARADGTELLLLGDTAWQMGNIETEQGPPALMAHMVQNDAHANACQLQELHDLLPQNPTLHVMPGHDLAHETELVAKGVLVPQFI